jgi:hypothetical protein
MSCEWHFYDDLNITGLRNAVRARWNADSRRRFVRKAGEDFSARNSAAGWPWAGRRSVRCLSQDPVVLGEIDSVSLGQRKRPGRGAALKRNDIGAGFFGGAAMAARRSRGTGGLRRLAHRRRRIGACSSRRRAMNPIEIASSAYAHGGNGPSPALSGGAPNARVC